MKILIKIQALISLLILSSCGSHRVYTTGSYGSIKTYTEKQHYVEAKTTETYISGDFSIGKHMQDGDLFDDEKIIASLGLHQNTTGKFYNYYYGFGGSLGSYKFKQGFKDLIQYGEKHSFYNIFLKTGANITYSRPKTDYRFIGLEFSYLNEFGPYQDKLKDLIEKNDNDLIIVNQNSLFSYHIYSEYVLKIKDTEAFTFGFYFGDIMNLKDNSERDKVNYSGCSFGYRIKDYTIYLMFESGQNKIRSGKFGLTYRL